MDQSIYNRYMQKLYESSHTACSDHCYHLHTGPYMRVLPNGHILQKCCHCSDTRTIHRDHAWENFRNSNHCTSVEISWK